REGRSPATVAASPGRLAGLRRDQKARRAAGLDAPLLNARAIRAETAMVAAGGLRSRDGATLDPYRACIGLAAAAAERGAQIFERSPVKKTTFTRKAAAVQAAGGKLRAGKVVVATGVPTALFHSLRRHFWFRRASLVLAGRVPAKIRRQLLPDSVVIRDSAVPPHVVRWVGEDQLIVMGADLESPPDRQRDRILVQRTGQLMYELSTLYPEISGIMPEVGWDAPYVRTDDG